MILDCTLRDGGYYTNWNFDTQMVKDLVQALDLSGVGVMEMGYKSLLRVVSIVSVMIGLFGMY